MTAANIQITQGAGTRLATNSYSEGGVTVHDEKFIPGEYPYPSYVALGQSVSTATSGDHLLQLMAGSTLNVRIRRIRIEQSTNATTAALGNFQIIRLTSAGTGGSAVTPGRYNEADAASGAAARTLPTAQGTEGAVLARPTMVFRQAISATTAQADDVWEWVQLPNLSPIVIPAGTANGIAIEIITGIAGATVQISIEFVETSF